jgi:hypothetical protein
LLQVLQELQIGGTSGEYRSLRHPRQSRTNNLREGGWFFTRRTKYLHRPAQKRTLCANFAGLSFFG